MLVSLASLCRGLNVGQRIKHFSTSAVRLGRKSRVPFDKRFPVTGKHVNATPKGLERGGNPLYPSFIGEQMAKDNPTVIKYTDKVSGQAVVEQVPEMIPEFIVPDLKDFLLKPYVSYKVPNVVQSEFTSKDLFDATYGQEMIKNASQYVKAGTPLESAEKLA